MPPNTARYTTPDAPLERQLHLFWRKVRNKPHEPESCWEHSGSVASNGYPQATVANGLVATVAHRRSWELTYGPIPSGAMVLHTCDNKKCIRPTHLYLGTHRDNMDDIVERRRRHGQSTKRVPDKEREYIRASPLSGVELSKELGRDIKTIYRIRNTK